MLSFVFEASYEYDFEDEVSDEEEIEDIVYVEEGTEGAVYVEVRRSARSEHGLVTDGGDAITEDYMEATPRGDYMEATPRGDSDVMPNEENLEVNLDRLNIVESKDVRAMGLAAGGKLSMAILCSTLLVC